MSSQSNAFDKLSRPVQSWIYKQKWPALREVQERTINAFFSSEQDLIISAATAGGKTEAAFLPLMSRVSDTSKQISDCDQGPSGFSVLALSPLKALINDQFDRLSMMGEPAQVQVHRWHGDVSQSEKKKARAQPAGILLITPESLEAFFVRRPLELAKLFGALDAVVIDEFHAFIGRERGIQLLSLLTRLEALIGHRPRRLALSATLGDRYLAQSALNLDEPESVQFIEPTKSEDRELLLQVRGYQQGREAQGDEEDGPNIVGSADRLTQEHLFKVLRGDKHLLFAGSRQRVEAYTNGLNQLCELANVPEEFFPHHGNLSKEIRYQTEERLKSSERPATAVCTSTLELGIDIGSVNSVACIHAPRSISSLKQRLGRSGRRVGSPSILRIYVHEAELHDKSHPIDQLRFDTVLSVAAIELLLENWCEPGDRDALHLSTLVQQCLSAIIAASGVHPQQLFELLCERGPFRAVSKQQFAQLLRQIGNPEVCLIEQSPEGLLMLGPRGEQISDHFSFYAAFQTPEEYRVSFNGKTLGSIPVESLLAEGIKILFAAKSWIVTAVDDEQKVITVVPDPTGEAPKFGRNAAPFDRKLAAKVREVYLRQDAPLFLNSIAQNFLQQGRKAFKEFGLEESELIQHGTETLFFPWTGSKELTTWALSFLEAGYKPAIQGFALVLETDPTKLASHIESVRQKDVNLYDLALKAEDKERYPLDQFLGEELLARDFAAEKLAAPNNLR